ncbi:MAG: FecR domain-containing protein [Chitinophaga sp.]|uniref:FecR family protein n=1 Tax=Chitinophaga sp. TaxID=1869181 RepID=UPI0025B9615F|nr:FecR family protein [Chitinophaga sp.]MBV8254768.1 FecR domain-containing protein [Chitinophaga sp.]
MTKEQLDTFLKDYAAGNYSQQEYQAFRHWMASASAAEQLEVLDKYGEQLSDVPGIPSMDLRRIAMIERALDDADLEKKDSSARIVVFRKWWAAAAILILIGAGTALLLHKGKAKSVEIAHKVDMPPGKDGAILTLGDGSRVVLDSLGNGIVAHQNGSSVVLDSGKIGYALANANENREPQFNILSTPVGRQFKVVLPDGTNVWLNAQSTVKYPTFFKGDDRIVEVTGEVYMEVAPDEKHPFKVNIKRADKHAALVEVLGTHFNINAYPDESTCRITLVQGAVMVSAADNAKKEILKPDQQASISETQQISIQYANTESVTAWKNGYFDFEDNDLPTLTRQLTRWYGVETKITEKVSETRVGGKISRNLMLADMIKVLNQAGVRCRIEDYNKLVFVP